MSSQCQSGECNRKAFEMPSGCPPVEKPPIVDVQACELPSLVPTDFEKHPLVVDLPSIPINVSCSCIDIETHMTLADDRHTPNYVSFHQAEGVNDCCMGIYALDLQLNIPTCSSSPPKITGQGSRGITVSGKGHARADEPCMFDLDMDITVPCPLEGITVGDGKGIAKIEKGPPPSFADCSLSFDVNVPCPLPGITFTVTGQASGSIVTGGRITSIAADGNHSTVDSGGNGGGRVGGNTVLSFGRPRIFAASGGGASGGGASGASGGGGGGGGDPCTLELKLNVPCQLPGVSFTVTGQASGGVKPKPSGGSFTGAECKTDLELNVPCQLPNIKVLKTIKPYSPTTQNPKISLKDALRLIKATGASEECEASLQLEADDVTVPCEGLSLDITGPASGIVIDSSNDCDKTLSITVDCQLDALALDVTGEATGEIVNDTSTLKACSKKITLDVPCQLEKLKFKTDYGEETPVPAPTGGVIDPGNIVWYSTGAAGSCDESSDGVTLHLRKFKVPVVKVDKASGSRITIEPVVEDNITTYKLGGGGVEYSGWTENNGGHGTIGITIGSDNKIKPTGGNGDVHLVNNLKIKDNYIKRVMVHLYFRHGLYQGVSTADEYNSGISVTNC